MKRRIKKLVGLIGIVTFTFLGGAHGGVIISLAAGPGETTQTVAKPVTYNQQSVRALGNWEQQSNGVWKFKCLDGSFLTNAWLESSSEAGAYYYINGSGVMMVNATTPDGYQVDAKGLWRSGVQNTGNSQSSQKEISAKDYGSLEDYYKAIAEQMINDPEYQNAMKNIDVTPDKNMLQ